MKEQKHNRLLNDHEQKLKFQHELDNRRPNTVRYDDNEIDRIGLGDPQNLAAFDLPLSYQMSASNPERKIEHATQGQVQGQGGSQYDSRSMCDRMSRSQAINSDEFSNTKTPRQSQSKKPPKALENGGQDRAC